MDVNYIALAIPVFFVFIAIELAVGWKKGQKLYHFSDAITDMACGVSEQTVMFFFTVLLLGGYQYLYDRWRLVTFPAHSIAAWVVGFFAVDVAYYWWHRLSHRVNFLWAVHVVHHQSEDLNLAVALRQAILTDFTQWPFYGVLALAGIPTVVFVTTASLSTLYQFWIHTELVGKLGPAEKVINTPSAHRVHHAVNTRYLDRNYAAVLIIWDRLFRSYEPEVEPPIYGLSKPLRSFNPLWAQFHYWVEMAEMARKAPGFWQGLQVFWRGPSWQPPWITQQLEDVGHMTRETFQKYLPPASLGTKLYVGVHFVYIVAATFGLLMWGTRFPTVPLAVFVALILVSLQSWGALLESKRWAVPLELARLALIAASGIAWFWSGPYQTVAIAAALGFVAASAAWLLRGIAVERPAVA